MFEKFAEDVLQRVNEKLAERRINNLLEALSALGINSEADTGGLFAHSFGGSYGNFKDQKIPIDKVINQFHTMMDENGYGTLKTPLQLAAQNIEFSPEADNSVADRITVKGLNNVKLPEGTTVDKKTGKMTMPLINRSGRMKPSMDTSLGAKGIHPLELAQLIGSPLYNGDMYGVFPKVEGAGNSPFSVSVSSNPGFNTIYGNQGFLMAGKNAEGPLKLWENSAFFPHQENSNEIRMYPKFNDDMSITTTQWGGGIPYYIVGNEKPSPERIKEIQELKKRVPGILPIKMSDIAKINRKVKGVPVLDLQALPNSKYNYLQQSINATSKAMNQVEEFQKTPLYKKLMTEINFRNLFGSNPKLRFIQNTTGKQLLKKPFKL